MKKDMGIEGKINEWVKGKWLDEKDRLELLHLVDKKEKEDRFYKNLEFGTGGMRGVRGVGSNRINKYMIGRATQGLANYMLKIDKDAAMKKGVAIAYDCRIGSREYAIETALVLAANNIKSYLFKELKSTPELSFAVRELGCQAGVVITASHNPVEYNGYKIYWSDGGQIVDPQASGIVAEVDAIEDLSKVKKLLKSEAIEKNLFSYIDKTIDDRYIEEIKKQVVTREITNKKNFKIVYTPLHGTGRVGVQRILSECGFESVYTVASQEMPDGNFPTCSYANPEDPKVFELGVKLANEKGANIVMANDPDADRIGVAVKTKNGDWIYPNGNQIGLLLMNYILENRKAIPANGAIISTVVSTPMLDMVAAEKGVKVVRTLTGFKFIGEKIREFEEGKLDGTYLFGFEESYGYLVGTHARDKDAIVSTLLIAEMAAKYAEENSSIPEKLEELYEKYGYYKEGISAITKDGKSGSEEIAAIMTKLRDSSPTEVAGQKVTTLRDFGMKLEKNLIEKTETKINLPKSNVIQFVLADGTHITARPSGTEPKIKYYYGVNGDSQQEVDEKLKRIVIEFEGSL